jgi:hypothetical protein
MNHLRRAVYSLCLLALAGLALARPSHAQSTIFADEFNSGSLGGSWNVYGTDRWLSRTQFGNAPTFGTEGSTQFMRLRLDTYNAEYPGTTLRGTEIHTKTQYGMGSGIQVEARVRAPGLPSGIIWAFFLLGERGIWPDTYSRDEIDFENLTSLASNEIWTNIYNDFNPNINPEGGSEMIKTAAGLNRNNWTIYKIKWYPDRVEWWVNVGSGADILVRSETDPRLVTDDPQSIRFNIWAADANWALAYGDLPLADNPSQNTSYYFDVDYVRMTSIGARGTVGDGDGLKGDYYDNKDFTGKTFSRVDQRVNFDWSVNAPDPTFDKDSFSIRWTGKVQAMFSETYTFYVKSDDGARLWVNGKQLINQWKNQGTTEYKGTIALTAGQKYDIKLEYFDNTYSANVLLSWSSPSTSKTVVPKSQLYSGYAAPPPPPPPSDTTPPSAVIFSPTNDGNYKVVYGANGTAADAGGSGLANVKLTLQRASNNLYYTGSGWSATKTELAVDGAANWSWGFPYLADGQYFLQAVARDVAGNVGYSNTVSFNINNSSDATPPTVSIASPANGNSYQVVYGANGSAADTGGSGLSTVRLTLQRASDNFYYTGGGWSPSLTELTPDGIGSWSWGFPYLPNGQYSLQAIARDGAGNIGRSSVVAFTIGTGDNVSPAASITTPVNTWSYNNLSSATGSATDNVGVTEVRVRLQRVSDSLYWNGSAWSATATEILASGTTSWSFALPNLADGSYALRATARDAAGNTGNSNVTQFVVDKTAPTITVIEPKPGKSYSSLPAANGTASDGNGLWEVRCIIQRNSDGRFWNGSQWVTTWTELLASGTTNWSFTMPSLSGGNYTFWAVARDWPGNQTYANAVSFTIQ